MGLILLPRQPEERGVCWKHFGRGIDLHQNRRASGVLTHTIDLPPVEAPKASDTGVDRYGLWTQERLHREESLGECAQEVYDRFSLGNIERQKGGLVGAALSRRI